MFTGSGTDDEYAHGRQLKGPGIRAGGAVCHGFMYGGWLTQCPGRKAQVYGAARSGLSEAGERSGGAEGGREGRTRPPAPRTRPERSGGQNTQHGFCFLRNHRRSAAGPVRLGGR
ncbi:hypothetical protein NSERUTF1_7151 [Nocardia seriolae]|nr:hypothetical protein NSERUTF1_7151 [Nocardia seriolae]